MPDRDSPTKLAKKCFWPRGKRSGKRISARTIGYLFEDDTDKPSPTIDTIQAVAEALQLPAWKLFSPENLVLLPSSSNGSIANIASVIARLNEDGIKALEESAEFISSKSKYQTQGKQQT